MNNIITEKLTWHKTARVEEIPEDSGGCVMVHGKQIAVYNFKKRNEWYAAQNLCPHKMQMILSRGMIGDKNGEPKVACPFHKKSFSLKTGACLSGEEYCIDTYPVKVENGYVYIGIKE
jgi:nitrite reductase (NADH) small subunit